MLRPRALVGRSLIGGMRAPLTDDRSLSRRLLLDTLSGFTTPSTQTVYSTLAEVTAACGRTPTEWYAGNLALGNWTGVNGTVLTKGAGTFRFGQTWPGWNGSDMTSLQAVEFLGTDSTAQAFAAADNDVYDLDESLTFVFQLRMARGPGGNRALFGKDTSSASTTAGYYCQISTAGGITLLVCDGSTTVSASSPGILTGLDSIASGAAHWIALKMNLTTGQHQVLAFRDSGTAQTMPAGTKTSATPFRVGGIPFLFSCETLQILQWGVFTGAEAEAFTLTDLNELDDVGAVPSPLTGHARSHVIAPVVGENASGLVVQHCAGSTTTPNKTDFAYCYKSNATSSTQKLGVLCERGVADSSDTAATNLQKRNRLLHTDNLNNAAWTKSNATTAANAGNDPGGFFASASLTASADNGFARQDFTSEIDEQHTLSIFIRRNGGSDVAGRLVAIRTDTSAELGAVAFTATSVWQRISVKVTTPTTTTRS